MDVTHHLHVRIRNASNGSNTKVNQENDGPVPKHRSSKQHACKIGTKIYERSRLGALNLTKWSFGTALFDPPFSTNF